jgi:hypothetical protein
MKPDSNLCIFPCSYYSPISVLKCWSFLSEKRKGLGLLRLNIGSGHIPNGTLFPNIVLWSKVVDNIGNRVPFGTLNTHLSSGTACCSWKDVEMSGHFCVCFFNGFGAWVWSGGLAGLCLWELGPYQVRCSTLRDLGSGSKYWVWLCLTLPGSFNTGHRDVRQCTVLWITWWDSAYWVWVVLELAVGTGWMSGDWRMGPHIKGFSNTKRTTAQCLLIISRPHKSATQANPSQYNPSHTHTQVNPSQYNPSHTGQPEPHTHAGQSVNGVSIVCTFPQ